MKKVDSRNGCKKQNCLVCFSKSNNQKTKNVKQILDKYNYNYEEKMIYLQPWKYYYSLLQYICTCLSAIMVGNMRKLKMKRRRREKKAKRMKYQVFRFNITVKCLFVCSFIIYLNKLTKRWVQTVYIVYAYCTYNKCLVFIFYFFFF